MTEESKLKQEAESIVQEPLPIVEAEEKQQQLEPIEEVKERRSSMV